MYNCVCTALVRVELKDGTYHEDVGIGDAIGSTKGMVIDKAKKVFFCYNFNLFRKQLQMQRKEH